MNIINLIYNVNNDNCCIKIQHDVNNIGSTYKIKFYNSSIYLDYVYYEKLNKFYILKLIKMINTQRYIVRNINVLFKIPEEWYDIL